MAIYAIGDLHLSVAAKTPMDIFQGWDNHAEMLIEIWTAKIKEKDTVVLAGDISWGMKMSEAVPDFRLIEGLPGEKIILKGNHDHWWGSVTSMNRALEEHEIRSIRFLHNNSYLVEGLEICGSRGWLFEDGAPHDVKIVRRETNRIEASLKSVEDAKAEKLLFLHYPPIFNGQELTPFIELMKKYKVKRCYYGHIHGPGHKYAVNKKVYGIKFEMISADFIAFDPILIKK
ncbi:MAG: metallophosphoesterase [Oscillospiraceae bacterium]